VCLHVGWTAKKKILRHLVVACAEWTHRRLLSSDTVKVAGQKRTVACSRLGDGDALASDLAKFPVRLQVSLSSQNAMFG